MFLALLCAGSTALAQTDRANSIVLLAGEHASCVPHHLKPILHLRGGAEREPPRWRIFEVGPDEAGRGLEIGEKVYVDVTTGWWQRQMPEDYGRWSTTPDFERTLRVLFISWLVLTVVSLPITNKSFDNAVIKLLEPRAIEKCGGSWAVEYCVTNFFATERYLLIEAYLKMLVTAPFAFLLRLPFAIGHFMWPQF